MRLCGRVVKPSIRPFRSHQLPEQNGHHGETPSFVEQARGTPPLSRIALTVRGGSRQMENPIDTNCRVGNARHYPSGCFAEH